MNARRVASYAILIAFACGCSSVDDANNLPQCEGPVELSVSSGTTPTFSWTPQCREGQVIVTPTLSSGFVTLWLATGTDNTNTLRPGIRYGHPPAPAALGTPPLQVGTPYTVHLLRATGDSITPFEAIGSADFTP